MSCFFMCPHQLWIFSIIFLANLLMKMVLKWFNLHFSDYFCIWTVFSLCYCISLSVARHVLCIFFYLCILFYYWLYILFVCVCDYIYSLYTKGSILYQSFCNSFPYVFLNSAHELFCTDFSYLYILRSINLCLWVPSLVLYLFHFKTVIFAFYISYFFTSFTFDSIIHNDLIFAILFRTGI